MDDPSFYLRSDIPLSQQILNDFLEKVFSGIRFGQQEFGKSR